MESNAAVSDQQGPARASRQLEIAAITPALFLLSDLGCLLIAWALVATIPPQEAQSSGALLRPSVFALWICLCSWLAAKGHYTSRNSLLPEVLQITVGLFLAAFVQWSMRFDGVPISLRDVAPWMLALLLIPAGRLALK